MTRKEAIEELKKIDTLSLPNGYLGKMDEALKMAIEALQKEPCEDCISRQAVLECLDWYEHDRCEIDIYIREIVEDIKKLPSVQPEQKEITMEDVKAYCEPRNLVVLTKELFDSMSNLADKVYLYLQDRERRFHMGYGTGIDEGVLNAIPKKMAEWSDKHGTNNTSPCKHD